MTVSDMKINVSGGNASFGNINQGDNAQLESSQVISFEAVDVEAFYQSIANIAAYNNIDFNDYQQLRAQVADLVKHPEQPGFMETVEELYDKYSWALKPLGALFSTVCVGS
jgi:hypothetical protein